MQRRFVQPNFMKGSSRDFSRLRPTRTWCMSFQTLFLFYRQVFLKSLCNFCFFYRRSSVKANESLVENLDERNGRPSSGWDNMRQLPTSAGTLHGCHWMLTFTMLLRSLQSHLRLGLCRFNCFWSIWYYQREGRVVTNRDLVLLWPCQSWLCQRETIVAVILHFHAFTTTYNVMKTFSFLDTILPRRGRRKISSM